MKTYLLKLITLLVFGSSFVSMATNPEEDKKNNKLLKLHYF